MRLYKYGLLLVFLCTHLCTWAGEQPVFFKKARKTQATLIAYTEKGEMRQGQAVFLDEKGTIATPYDLLKTATRATLVDTDGKEHQVRYVKGASSLYNVARIESSHSKSNYAERIPTKLPKGTTVWVMPMAGSDKKAEAYRDTISDVQQFGDDQYPYYQLTMAADERLTGTSVFSETGMLIGFLQPSASGAGKAAYVLGADYVFSLSTTALDANNADLRAILIDKALPEDEAQATSYLFLSSRLDDDAFGRLTEQYITKFPQSTVGYVQRAERQVANKLYSQAETTYQHALQAATGMECDIHHSYANMLYQTAISTAQPAEGWTLDHALAEAEAAYTASPQPLYKALEGMCLYALKRYDEACECFLSLSQTNMRGPEYFSYAAQCKQMMKAAPEEVLALQDSAVACFTKPYPAAAANHLYLRAQTLASLKKFREAVSDMNEFEHLASGNVSATFCYEREQMEMQCRLYPAALSDIERAVRLAPNEPLFRAEEAVVNYRVGQIDEAMAAAREAIRLAPDFPDAHRILGICQNEQGKKDEARKSLLRAQELGDAAAAQILEKIGN